MLPSSFLKLILETQRNILIKYEKVRGNVNSAYKSLKRFNFKIFFFLSSAYLPIAIPCLIQIPSYFLNHWNNLPVVFTSRHHHLKAKKFTSWHLWTLENRKLSLLCLLPHKVFFVFPVLWRISLNSIADHLRGFKPGSPALQVISLKFASPGEPVSDKNAFILNKSMLHSFMESRIRRWENSNH